MAVRKMNVVAILGNLTSDPRYRNAGATPFVNFQVALNERTKGADGVWKDDDPTLISVNCFGNQAENVNKLCHKGTLVAVTGRLKQERWTDKQNVPQTRLVVVANEVAALDRLRPIAEAAPVAAGTAEDEWAVA